ncbi:hypothetical protein [Plantibacter sp. YIM 135249]|uniref:hypothetical protein n=1 Tax=Plantibacter sp. YIM 135249 TaxID=3423918 RepID=UPI003D3385C6
MDRGYREAEYKRRAGSIMTAVVSLLSAGDAQRLTQRIKLTASVVRDNLFKLRNLVDEAKNSNAWQVLGFQSWTAYLADTLGDEPMRLGREERQELVGYLAGEGLSVRAIAPIVGAAKSQVARDIQDAPVPIGTPEPDLEPLPPANPFTGEVIEEPAVVTETHTVKVVTGLDGKEYAQKPREPKPVVVGDAASRQNAETAAKEIADAIDVMWRFGHVAHRTRILTDWWPLGKAAVPPASRGLFNPGQLRQIAESLVLLATEMENLDV